MWESDKSFEGSSSVDAVPCVSDNRASSGLRASLWSFRGRIGRRTYWIEEMTTFFLGLIAYVLAVLNGFLKGDTPTSGLVCLPFIALAWVGLAAKVKRWHDLDHSGWMILLDLAVIPLPFTFIYTYFFKGTTGPNRFGADPV